MNILFAFVLIVFAALSRLIPHAPNFTPVISTALFAGAYLGKRLAFLVPVAAMLLSDVLIGFYGFASMAFIYGSLLMIVILGTAMKGRTSPLRIGALSLAGAVLFFVVTNFGVWVIPNSFYPKTLSGLFECFVMAIPFFGNTVLSALIYSAVIFGAYELAEKYVFKSGEKSTEA